MQGSEQSRVAPTPGKSASGSCCVRGGSAWAWAWQAKNSLYGQHAGRWATHISDSGLLIDLGLEVLENALVDHFVGWGDVQLVKR